jgi:hypothetical protein
MNQWLSWNGLTKAILEGASEWRTDMKSERKGGRLVERRLKRADDASKLEVEASRRATNCWTEELIQEDELILKIQSSVSKPMD